MPTQLWAAGLVVLASFCGALGVILLKKARTKKILGIRYLVKNYYLTSGIILYGLGILLYVLALRGGSVSVLYPILALIYIWVSLLSIRFLGEKMNRAKWIGVILIIIGVSFIGIGSQYMNM